MELKVQDEALDWPGNPELPRSASKKPNVRNLKIVIPISSSRLNIRTLDKSYK
jgi:hypothetical protein